MDATPVEQVVAVAVATKCTGLVYVDLLTGLVTVTVAKAEDTLRVAKSTAIRRWARGVKWIGFMSLCLREPGRNLAIYKG
jgi:hypothetical protein